MLKFMTNASRQRWHTKTDGEIGVSQVQKPSWFQLVPNKLFVQKLVCKNGVFQLGGGILRTAPCSAFASIMNLVCHVYPKQPHLCWTARRQPVLEHPQICTAVVPRASCITCISRLPVVFSAPKAPMCLHHKLSMLFHV